MKTKALPPFDYLQNLFEVLPEEGKLLWKVNKGGKARAGMVAGASGQVTIDYTPYSTYRIIYALTYGEDYDYGDEIDHINRNRSDNRISNLRKVTHAENLRNRGLLTTNTSGYPGVHYCNRKNRRKRWRAGIMFEGRRIYLGMYATLEEAISARKEAEIKYGYLPATSSTGVLPARVRGQLARWHKALDFCARACHDSLIKQRKANVLRRTVSTSH